MICIVGDISTKVGAILRVFLAKSRFTMKNITITSSVGYDKECYTGSW